MEQSVIAGAISQAANSGMVRGKKFQTVGNFRKSIFARPVLGAKSMAWNAPALRADSAKARPNTVVGKLV
jgi:hypothetical protein